MSAAPVVRVLTSANALYSHAAEADRYMSWVQDDVAIRLELLAALCLVVNVASLLIYLGNTLYAC